MPSDPDDSKPRLHPGYVGMFTRAQAPGAYLNGTAIVKRNSVPGDATPDGGRGVVLGSIITLGPGFGYFIEWALRPGVAVFVAGYRVELAP